MNPEDIFIEQAALLAGRRHGARRFRPGQDVIPVSGKVIGEPEFANSMQAVCENVLTAGPWTKRFERGLATFLGMRHARMVNSGSSANLLALAALMDKSALEEGNRRSPLEPGDPIATAMLGFPTTVNPIIQNGMIPIFVDVDLGTYVPNWETLRAAADHSVAFMLAHTLGNPWPVSKVREKFPYHFIIEDNCDALGSWGQDDTSADPWMTGTVGDVATQSFYPAHHITTGEGGAVLSNDGRLMKVVESLRDWGRACWCEPGKENTCGKRFGWDFPPLPFGTDHKYIYERIGYNLKATDMQAALGVAQLQRLPGFGHVRRLNFARLLSHVMFDDDVFILPRATPGSDPSWFGFPLTLRPEVPATRADVVRFLWKRKIDSRPIFAGAMLQHPAYKGMMKAEPGIPLAQGLRVDGMLGVGSAALEMCPNSVVAAQRAFWVGVWPALTEEVIDFVGESLHEAADLIRRGKSLEEGT